MIGDDTAGARRPSPSLRSAIRSEAGSALELSALVGFAVVQPVLGPFGESPETFTGVDASPGQIVLFAVLVAVVPILGLWSLAAFTRVGGPRVRSIVQTALVAALAAMAAVAVARHLGWAAGWRSFTGLAVGAMSALIHRRWQAGRLFLRYASPVPILLVLSFLFASPVSSLVQPSSVDEGAAPAGRYPPVVFIVLDELPTLSLVDGRGGIDADLFPNIARVAGTSTWYRNHSAVTSATQSSVSAMLRGQVAARQADHRLATDANYPDTLLTLLAMTHQVHGREWATSLCPRSVCPGRTGEIDAEAEKLLTAPLSEPPAPLDALTDAAQSLWWSQVWPPAPPFEPASTIEGKTDADDRTRLMLEFITGIEEQPGDRPTFEYLHAPFPHTPWTALPSGQSYDAPDTPFGAEFLLFWPKADVGQDMADASRVRHLLQLQWTDRLLGGIIDRLETVDRWDDAVVVVTSDHGVAFQAGHSMRTIDAATQVQMGWTPLFIKEPGQATGRVVDDNVTALDVAPTVADLVGVDVDWELQGESLADGVSSTSRPKPMSVREPQTFDVVIEDDLVSLDADGLAAITSTTATGPASDDLRVWRHGRQGELLGRGVDEVGVCDGRGPAVEVEPSPTWDDYVAGTLRPGAPLPLWRQGTIEGDEGRDVAAVVDGNIVGWSVTQPSPLGAANRFGMLLTEPLVRSASGAPRYYEIVDEPGCRLRPLAT